MGASAGSTTLHLLTDLYVSGNTPAYFLVPYNFGGFPAGKTIQFRDLSFKGPGSGTLGNSPNKTTAIWLNGQGRMVGCVVTAFFAAVGVSGDHQWLRECNFSGNYYGVDFPTQANLPGFAGSILLRQQCLLMT